MRADNHVVHWLPLAGESTRALSQAVATNPIGSSRRARAARVFGRAERGGRGDPNRLIKERRYGTDSAMGPFHKREYWYDPAGNRVAMRESTPTGETTDTVNAVTCYNYWRMTTLLSNTAVAPGTPSGTAAYASGKAKDQLLSEQRVEYSGSDVTHVTGTVYRHGTQVGAWHRNAMSEEYSRRSKKISSTDWRKLHERTDDYAYHNFMFLSHIASTWENYADDSGNALTDQGRLDEYYSYDWLGRLTSRTTKGCTRTCGYCPEAHMNACDQTCPGDKHVTIFYGYDGQSNQVLSERGAVWKSASCEPESFYHIHATYTPGALGNLMRVDRAGTTETNDDERFEPLLDGMFNNVGAAWDDSGLQIDFEQTLDAPGLARRDPSAAADGPLAAGPACQGQTTAFGQMLTESGTGAPVAQLGSFAWRGREGTISYRYNTDVGHSNLFRMVHRPYDPTTGRFTESHRDILAGLGPLAANRYIYVEGDPVNRTDPLGFHNIKGAVIVGLIVGAIIATVIGMYIAAIKYQAATTFRSADPMMGVDLRGNDGRMEAVEEVMDEAIRMPGTFSSGSRGNPPTTLPSACKKLIGTPESPEE